MPRLKESQLKQLTWRFHLLVRAHSSTQRLPTLRLCLWYRPKKEWTFVLCNLWKSHPSSSRRVQNQSRSPKIAKRAAMWTWATRWNLASWTLHFVPTLTHSQSSRLSIQAHKSTRLSHQTCYPEVLNDSLVVHQCLKVSLQATRRYILWMPILKLLMCILTRLDLWRMMSITTQLAACKDAALMTSHSSRQT